ncbi:MAG: hypothetical protein JXB47_05005, partial [Anaerolineae bacterium]|nr:hypothetical protein [Anaerolineae bacterium]
AAFETIQAAWEASAPGDLIIIMPGEYRGVQAEEKSGADGAYIHFKAWGEPGSVVVSGTAFPEKDWLRDDFYFIDASYYIIEGIAFRDAPRAGLFFSGYFAGTGRFMTHIVVMNVYSHDNFRWGMHSTATSYVVVQDSVFTNSADEHGAYLSGSGDYMLVRRNVFQGNNSSGFQMNADPLSAEEAFFEWLGQATGGDTCGLSEDDIGWGSRAGWDDIKACYDRHGLPDLGPYIEDGIGEHIIVEQNVFTGNGAAGGAAVNLASVRDAAIRSNLIYGNAAGAVACWDDSYRDTKGLDVSPYGCRRLEVLNNTMVDTEGSRTALALNGDAGDAVVVNNIIVCPRDDAYEVLDTSSRGLVSHHNYYYQMWVDDPGLAAQLDDDPALTGFAIDAALANFAAPGFEPWVLPDGEWYRLNPARPDYHLLAGSPLAGAGDPAYLPALDVTGAPWPAANIGAFAGAE